MANININPNINDNYYRYKMPKIIIKIEGRGNGIKTVITNILSISSSINRLPSYIIKYFGYILCTTNKADIKNNIFYINGEHNVNKLQEILYDFIKIFVLCNECKNPETILKKACDKNIIIICKACGYETNIESKTNITLNKLISFIIKNLPEDSSIKKSSHKINKEKTIKFKKRLINKDNDYDKDWCDDISEDAIFNRHKSLPNAVKNIIIDNDLPKSLKERIDIFYIFVKNKIDNNKILESIYYKEIIYEANRLDIKNKSIMVLIELLFDINILLQIKKYINLFKIFTDNNLESQRYLLKGINKLICIYPILTTYTKNILQILYNEDIVEEEIIIEWYYKNKNNPLECISKMIKDSKIFINWLLTAEEESSDDEHNNLNCCFEELNLKTDDENDYDDIDIDAI